MLSTISERTKPESLPSGFSDQSAPRLRDGRVLDSRPQFQDPPRYLAQDLHGDAFVGRFTDEVQVRDRRVNSWARYF